MTDLQQVKDSLKIIAKHHWDTHKEPILLSNLPAVLEIQASGFKSVLGTQPLKAFIKSHATEMGVKLIEHPAHKAKIAVAPSNADFDFPSESAAESKGSKSSRPALKGEKAVLALLRSLSILPDQELDQVNIPVSILVKMMK